MEYEADEASYQHPKRRKSTNCAGIPSTSMKDSILEKIPNLPAELITEILSRLAVKSLLKFRSVSKSWLSLISSNEFINTHISRYNNKDQRHHKLMLGFNMHSYGLKDCSFRSFFSNPVIELSDLNYPVKYECGETLWVVGSVNGLICIAHGLHAPKDLFIWNPSIRRYKKLPSSKPIWKYDDCLYGFGYDELHDDYKVVGIFCIYGNRIYVDIKVYSLKNDSWRKIRYLRDGMCFSSCSVFVKGKLHWTTRAFDHNECKDKDIITFGLADENWGKMEKPSYGEAKSISKLGVLGSDLCGFSHDLAIGVDIWVMKEYGLKESWTKMCTITYPKLESYLYFPSIFLSNNGDVLIGYGSMFIIYNPKDDSFRYPKVINCAEWRMGTIYIESLVSPLSTEGLRSQQRQCVRQLRSRKSSNK